MTSIGLSFACLFSCSYLWRNDMDENRAHFNLKRNA